MKKTISLIMFLLSCMTVWAQDVCYLIGTDGVFEANHASATLTKNDFGEYVGEVTFATYIDGASLKTYEFTITTKLGETADDWDGIERYRYCPNPGDYQIGLNEEKELSTKHDYKQNLTLSLWGWEEMNPTRWVKVSLKSKSVGSIIIYESKEEDPDTGATTDYTPIDLSQGVHFTVTVNEAGKLKQRLENAVFQTDYDLVDYLTVRGKLGGADIAYLQAQEGLVSQLQYLDISQVELVYDDEPYFQNGHGGFYSSHTNIFTLSAENYDEQGDGGQQGQVTVTSTICHRNDLSHAFESMKHLKECYLPKTLTAIGENMFSGTPIAKVGMPSAPTYIGDYAFENQNLWYEAPGTLDQIDIPSSVKSIGVNAFIGQPIKSIDVSHVTSFGEGCLSHTYIQSITLNDQVEMIPGTMFSQCTKLTAINIPANVVEIGSSAFSGCEKLATVTMGDKVKKIGAEAFSGCTSLENVTISSNIEEIGRDAFASVYYYGTVMSDIPWVAKQPNEGGVLYISKVAYKHLDGTDLNIKEGTVSLADGFVNAKGLNSITLPSTLRILGRECFKNAALSSIDLPESLEKIGEGAFAAVDGGSSKLRRITIPKNVKIIESGAFYGTPLVRVYYNAADANYKDVEHTDGRFSYERIFPESVTRVIIGEGVKSIPNGLFYDCKNIARVEMPSTVERIGDDAFGNCSSLSRIDLPSSLKYLGSYAFGGSGLTKVDSYLTEPLDFSSMMYDGQLTKNDAQWEPGLAINGTKGWYGPFKGTIYSDYSIDAEGNITWSNTYFEHYGTKLPLLRVPNGSLADYQSHSLWAGTFEKIEQFDGASSAEAVEETTAVTVSNEVTEETDLSSTMLGSIFVTLDTEDSGDGYNASEGCLVINSTVSDEQLAAATADGADDLTVKNQFNGLIFEVPAGKGTISIDCQTLGQNAIYVKIGSNEPEKVETATKQTKTIPYDVVETTRIYVYAAMSDAGTKAAPSRAIGTKPRRAAYANDDAVKIYGLNINVDENLSGISAPITTDRTTTGTWYTLDGCCLAGKPTMKGVYIRNGRKVVLR